MSRGECGVRALRGRVSRSGNAARGRVEGGCGVSSGGCGPMPQGRH